MVTANAYRALLLSLARAALAANVAEDPPGSHRGPLVDAYLASCVRSGRPLGVRGAPWCAAFASWCAWQAWATLNMANPGPAALLWKPGALAHGGVTAGTALPGGVRSGPLVVFPPIGYRAAVAELVGDAKASGAWREEASFAPSPGDLCIMARAGQDPRRGGEGHVAVFDSMADPPAVHGIAFWTIGGNEDHTVKRSLRCVCDEPGVGPAEPIVGFVAMGAGLDE